MPQLSLPFSTFDCHWCRFQSFFCFLYITAYLKQIQSKNMYSLAIFTWDSLLYVSVFGKIDRDRLFRLYNFLTFDCCNLNSKIIPKMYGICMESQVKMAKLSEWQRVQNISGCLPFYISVKLQTEFAPFLDFFLICFFVIYYEILSPYSKWSTTRW